MIGTTCRQIAPYWFGTACDPKSPYALPAETERRLDEALASVSHGGLGAEIRLVAYEEVEPSGALVLDEAPLAVLENRVRNAAAQELPAPHVQGQEAGSSAVVERLAYGIVVALATLTIGCLIPVTNRMLTPESAVRDLADQIWLLDVVRRSKAGPLPYLTRRPSPAAASLVSRSVYV